MAVELVMSGGQTGADSGSLLAAKSCGIATGGAMTEDWMTESGPRPEYVDEYGMHAIEGGYPERTQANVVNSDGTMILAKLFRSPGTKLTQKYCWLYAKPCVLFNADLIVKNPLDAVNIQSAAAWIRKKQIKILNVAGNRESKCPGLEAATERFMRAVLLYLRYENMNDAIRMTVTSS